MLIENLDKVLAKCKASSKMRNLGKYDAFNKKSYNLNFHDNTSIRTNPLYYHLYIYLADRKLKEFNNMQRNQTESYRGNTIPWIEKLLQTPIDYYRKNAVNLILAPYLINVKKLSYDAALNIINSWLSKCGESRQLDQNFDYTVVCCVKNENRPLKLNTLKTKNLLLFAPVRVIPILIFIVWLGIGIRQWFVLQSGRRDMNAIKNCRKN